jgi:hypothetical protein
MDVCLTEDIRERPRLRSLLDHFAKVHNPHEPTKAR